MTPEQISAFQAAGSMKPEATGLLLKGMFCASLLLWLAWVCVNAYRSTASGQLTWRQLGGVCGRAALVLLVCYWLVLS